MLHNVITNVSYDAYGKTHWSKAIYDSEEEARERAEYMNELDSHDYRVEKIKFKTEAL